MEENTDADLETDGATAPTTDPAPETDPTPALGKKHYPVRTWIFCGMLVLALVGMGLTMSREDGGWEFWIFLLTFYGGVSIFWAWQGAKAKQEPVWAMVRTQVFHWTSVFVIFVILVLFERTEIINRAAAANVALLVLSLACLLAGVHFEWTFLLVGIVLAIMVVALGFLEQYMVWIIMVPVIIAAGWMYYQIRKRRVKEPAKLD